MNPSMRRWLTEHPARTLVAEHPVRSLVAVTSLVAVILLFSWRVNGPHPHRDFTTLRLVIALFRHGNRSPLLFYPKDPYKDDKYWPDGNMELTKIGKRQLYQLGERLRERYDGFLSDHYLPSQIQVNSTLKDRTYMSAAILLAGLYPPRGYQLWNGELPWQPIPIWPDNFDINWVVENWESCPRYALEINNTMDAVEQSIPQLEELFVKLTHYSGWQINSILGVYRVYSTLSSESEEGLVLPWWTKGIYPEELEPIGSRLYQSWTAGGPENIITKLTAGLAANYPCHYYALYTTLTPGSSLDAGFYPRREDLRYIQAELYGRFMDDILTTLEVKASGRLRPDRQMLLRSCHDTTLVAVFNALGFTEPLVVRTSAALLLELHQEGSQFYVQLHYYNNSATRWPLALPVPRCDTPCRLERFVELIKPIVPADWNVQCEVT